MENDNATTLHAGLYLVSTPIGNIGDISSRAKHVLNSVDEIWAEDTRNTRKLLTLLDIKLGNRPLRANHDHNEVNNIESALAKIAEGSSIALVSDAGTPLVSDPGYRLVDAVLSADLQVTAIPGPSAVITALTLSGAPSDRFAFYGFVPNKTQRREDFLNELAQNNMTAIVFESAKRIAKTLEAIQNVLGNETRVTILREMTKKFEERIHGGVGDLVAQFQDHNWRGEIVMVISPLAQAIHSDAEVAAQLEFAMKSESLKQSVNTVTASTGWARKDVYRLALQIKDQN